MQLSADIDMRPSDYLKGIFGEEGKGLPDLAEYKLSFGKYNGLTIPEIAKKDMGWLVWAKENLTREPTISLINQYFTENDEI